MNRILIYGMSSKVGGVEEYLMNVYRNIDREKIQFDFIITDGEKVYCEEEIRKFGGNIFYPQKNSFMQKLRTIKKIIKIERENHDTIYFNSCGMYNILPYIYAKIYKYKNIIVHAHNTKDTSRKEIVHIFHYVNRWIVANFIATKLLACSKIAGEWIFGKNKVKQGKVEIIYNAIDVDRFKFNPETREKIRKELHIDNKFVIGHVGRFIYQKNHLFLLEVFKKVLEKRNDVVLLLIGEGKEKENIENYVKKNKMDRNVLFLGTKNNVNEYMQAMDAFALPSIYEGLGIVVIEAQVAGLKVAVSENIPKEAVITDLVSYIELKNLKEWCEFFIKLKNNYGRMKYFDTVVQSKYNIKIQIVRLQEILGEENEK